MTAIKKKVRYRFDNALNCLQDRRNKSENQDDDQGQKSLKSKMITIKSFKLLVIIC